MSVFDEMSAEYGGTAEEEAGQEAVNMVVSSLNDEDIDDELSEAEKRLSKAAYYKVIVKGGVIEDNGTPEASEINAEARLWARTQMAKLLGMQTEAPAPVQVKVEAQFSDKEVLALKKLAERVLSAGTKPEPVVNKVQTPAAPTVRKVPTSPAPTARVIKPKPQEKPQVNAKKPPSQQKPVKVATLPDGEFDYDAIPSGQPFVDPKNGKMYRFVDNRNFDPDVPGSKVRNKISVSTSVKNPGALPMPTAQQMTQISQLQAMDSVNNLAPANQVFPDLQGGQDVLMHAAAGSLNK